MNGHEQEANQRTLRGLPWYLYPFKIYNLQGPEEDVSNPGLQFQGNWLLWVDTWPQISGP